MNALAAALLLIMALPFVAVGLIVLWSFRPSQRRKA